MDDKTWETNVEAIRKLGYRDGKKPKGDDIDIGLKKKDLDAIVDQEIKKLKA